MQNTQKGQNHSTTSSAVAGPEEVRRFSESSGSQERRPVDRREVRRKLKDDIVAVFHEFMNIDESYGLKWRGSMVDLMELTHIAWQSDFFADRLGRPIFFCDMAKHICRVMHCHVVPNPYTFVERAKSRKGRWGMPVLDRYTDLAIAYHLRNPINLEIKHI